MKSAIELYVSKKAKEHRLAKGWSLRYLADCMNVSYTFTKNIEAPENNEAYNFDHVNVLARIFQCSLWNLIPKHPLDQITYKNTIILKRKIRTISPFPSYYTTKAAGALTPYTGTKSSYEYCRY